MQQNWFKSWFDSPYYHLLYNYRNYIEAEHFINNLFDDLQLHEQSKVLDLACGKGRHALQIHNLGNDVVGVDLSPQSIEAANLNAEAGLVFQTGDMRDLPFNSEFDLIVNLFTSFGYFQQEGDNVKVIESIAKALKNEGFLILDYLNVAKVVKDLPVSNVIQRDDIEFNVHKDINNGFIVKTIKFEDDGDTFEFKEHVKLLTLTDFEDIFRNSGLHIQSIYGDYELNPFDESKSDRLIFKVQKIN
ncbi:MAG: SAM-dependent methyltransferase [Vicingaceae bacterium]|jgi:SAM-dependent methyltransferase